MDANFDYSEALRRLEEIALKVEDPSTGIGETDKYIAESGKLIAQCREYLRSIKETL